MAHQESLQLCNCYKHKIFRADGNSFGKSLYPRMLTMIQELQSVTDQEVHEPYNYFSDAMSCAQKEQAWHTACQSACFVKWAATNCTGQAVCSH